MNRHDVDSEVIGRTVGLMLGLPFRARKAEVPSGTKVSLVPDDIRYSKDFSFEAVVGWRSLNLEFQPGSLAKRLVKAMEGQRHEGMAAFQVLCNAAKEVGATINLLINDMKYPEGEVDTWPDGWNNFVLTIEVRPFEYQAYPKSEFNDVLARWIVRLAGMALSFIPLEQEPSLQGDTEGAVIERINRRYERSPANRAACIDHFGCRCIVCDFDFEKTYGEIAAGFIEVHHKVPVSTITLGTIVDPIKDLVPLCSNCHSVVHRRYPPIDPQVVREILQQKQE